ncbi:hypothetical protein LSAT2_016735 [Lamellibrachia satsuma]|nr:hypothetical protein LSAT2_016735 [Lamellibrachia satsuma]
MRDCLSVVFTPSGITQALNRRQQTSCDEKLRSLDREWARLQRNRQRNGEDLREQLRHLKKVYDPSIGVKGESTPKFRRSMSTAAADAAVKTNVDDVDAPAGPTRRVRGCNSSRDAGTSTTVAQARQTLRKRHGSHKPVLLTPRNRLLQRQQQQERGSATPLKEALCDGELRSLGQRAPSDSDLSPKIAGIKGRALRQPQITESCPQLCATVSMAAPTPENFVFAHNDDFTRQNGVVSETGRADSPRPNDVTIQCDSVLKQFINDSRRPSAPSYTETMPHMRGVGTGTRHDSCRAACRLPAPEMLNLYSFDEKGSLRSGADTGRSLRATDRTNAAQLRLVHSWQGLRTLRTAMTAMTAIRSQVRDAVSGLQVKTDQTSTGFDAIRPISNALLQRIALPATSTRRRALTSRVNSNMTSRLQAHPIRPGDGRPWSCHNTAVDGAAVGDVTSGRQTVPRKALFKESRYGRRLAEMLRSEFNQKSTAEQMEIRRLRETLKDVRVNETS